jgi:hypothetical protein
VFLALMAGLVGYQVGLQHVSGQAHSNCFAFATGDKGCPECESSECGTCMGGDCQPTTMTVCFVEFDTTEDESGWLRESWERQCGAVYWCTFDPPCNGQACEQGAFKEVVPGTFETWQKGDKCRYSEPPGPPGGG